MNKHPMPPPESADNSSDASEHPLSSDWEYEEEPVRRPRSRRERAVVLFTDESGSIIRAGDAALDEDDLPVLTAFREFLEVERRRTRRQIRRLIAGFILGFAGVAVAGTWLVRQWILRFEERLETEKALAFERQSETASNLQTVAHAAVALHREVQKSTQKSAAVESDLARQREEMKRLLDSLRVLEVENALLERAVRRLEPERPVAPLPFVPPPPSDTLRVEREGSFSNRMPEIETAQDASPASKPPESPPGQTTPAGIRYRLSVPKE